MNQIIMWIMAVGAVLGGVDRIAGNRFGLGKRFEEGFTLLGPTALSMSGIICLTPLLSRFLRFALVPIWNFFGLDAGLLAGILAIDMGGYQLAGELSASQEMVRYAGLVIAATLGCTITFTIPVGMGMLKSGDRLFFSRGMLIGTGTLPVTMIVGGLLSGLSFLQIVLQSLPVLLFCFLLMFGIWRFPEQTVRAFTVFAAVIRLLTTIGLIAGAFCYMTGFSLLPDLAPLEDAMAVVSSIGIVLLGSLPTAELLQRVLKKPLSFIGRKTGMNDSSAAGLLMGIVSPVPAITMMEKMDERGKIVNAAFLVSAASTIAAHMGFTFGTDPDFVVPLLVAKLAGGIAAVCAALFFTKKSAYSKTRK